MATVLLISSTRSRTFARGRPGIFGTSPMFSVTVMCGKRPVAWMAWPMVRRSATGLMPVTSSPPMVICPEAGSISRWIILRGVLLPQPEGPTRISVSPAASSWATSSTAGAWLSG